MEDSTEKLLQQLGSIGLSNSPSGASQAAVGATEAVLLQAEKMDHWRILLVDYIYLLNASFRDVHYWEGIKAEKDTFKQFVKILHELNQMPDHQGKIRTTFRGSPGAKPSQKTDYVVQFGDLSVDAAAISGVVKRMGIRVKHLEGRLLKAFEAFSTQGIVSIFLKIPDATHDTLEKLRVSLRIISCFSQAVENDTAIEYSKDGKKHSLQPVNNEFNQPDPNLTQVAALNDLSPANMQEMVQKISVLMKRPDFAKSAIQHPNVYQAIFSIKSLKARLTRPPIEMNSDMATADAKDPGKQVAAGTIPGQMADNAATVMPGTPSGQVQTAALGPTASAAPGSIPQNGGETVHLQIDPAALKVDVARFVKEAYGASSEKPAQVMKTIFGQDYKQLNLQGLETRLQMVTDLLANIENSVNGRTIKDGVLQRIQAGMDQVPKEVLDDLVVDNNIVKIWDGDEEKIIGKADENLLNIIDTSKERSAARKKMRTALRPDAEFTQREYEELAANFNIAIHEAEEIVKTFKRCFDRQGHFQRALFEKNVSEFARYPKRIFEIMWEFLRETPRRNDRLPLLNSMQLLIKEIKQPKQAIKVLLAEFILDPNDVVFPDRNAIMLTIQFLRTYNKEINMDIEITPEEVLLVKEGLDPAVVDYAVWKVDADQKKFIEKIVTIRKKLLHSFEQENSDTQMLPIRFLLALEREVHIFFALIGGITAAAVIQGALNVYGNPASQIFRLNESRLYTPSLLQHLAVLIRGFGRVGQQKDVALLDDIMKNEEGFMNLADEPRHTAQVRRTLGLIAAAKTEMNAREC